MSDTNTEKKKRDIYWYAALAGIISAIIAFVALIITFIRPDPNPEPIVDDEILMSQESFIQKVEHESGSEVLYYNYNDYENNGEQEMFALVDDSTQNKGENDVLFGYLWFVNKKGAIQLSKDAIRFTEEPSTIMLEDRSFLVIEEYYDTGGCIYLWGVMDGKPFEFNISGQPNGLWVNNYNELEIIGEEYSSNYDKRTDIWTGHNWITYYLYFNGTDFREYGGRIISWDELCRCPGIGNIISKIESEKLSKGWKIGNIFYRENGIFNINIYYETDTDVTYEHITIREWEGSVIEYQYFQDIYGEGICKKAFLENIATYPDAYPY